MFRCQGGKVTFRPLFFTIFPDFMQIFFVFAQPAVAVYFPTKCLTIFECEKGCLLCVNSRISFTKILILTLRREIYIIQEGFLENKRIRFYHMPPVFPPFPAPIPCAASVLGNQSFYNRRDGSGC